MNNYILSLSTTAGIPMNPNGLIGLKLLYDKAGSSNVFRQKLSGSLSFVGQEFQIVQSLESECCQEVFATITQSCNNATLTTARFQSNQIEWDFELCEAKIPNLEIRDLYFGIYKFWEKKVNMCSIERTQALQYLQRSTIPNPNTQSSDTEINLNQNILNRRGVLLSEWLFHCVKQTLLGTPFESVIPANYSTISTFINLETSPITGRKNTLNTAVIFQASDFLFPNKPQATGITNLGSLAEEVAITLKDVLDNLEKTFDLLWFIDRAGFFRIEHISYFLNNLSYQPNTSLSLDLSNEKYQYALKDYKYSYKNDTSDFYGIETLSFTLNEAINGSDKATKTVVDGDFGTQVFASDYFFANISDFDFGNIKFDEACSPFDEKGSLKKKERSNSIFMTAFEPLRLSDSTIDKTKYILLDCKTDGYFTTDGLGKQFAINAVVTATCERVAKKMPNGNFSATAIMRDFLRYNKPFSAGLMSYNQKPIGSLATSFIERGLTREMYSVLKPKRLKRIIIPFCCGDPSFNPYLHVKLPNGILATVEKAEFELATETLNLDLSLGSNCSISIKFPTVQSGDNYPVLGTILYTEPLIVTVQEYICDENGSGCYLNIITKQGIRTYFADGSGASYYQDVIN